MASLDTETGGRNAAGNDAVAQFLNPEAMLTPGLAGALVMMITNGLATNFPLSRTYTGLLLSFVVGLLVLVANREWWLKAVYYLVDSLIIFCVAFGANGVGSGIVNAAPRAVSLEWPISSAVAQSLSNAPNEEQPSSSVPSRNELEETIQRQQAIIEQLQKQPSNSTQDTRSNSFFSPWTR